MAFRVDGIDVLHDGDILEIFDCCVGEARFFDKIDVWHTLVHERERERVRVESEGLSLQ